MSLDTGHTREFLVPIDALVGAFDEDRNITESVRRYGIRCPITVTARPEGGYRVIDGHKRVAAVRALGATTIVAYEV